jgi:hypothetical protein
MCLTRTKSEEITTVHPWFTVVAFLHCFAEFSATVMQVNKQTSIEQARDKLRRLSKHSRTLTAVH